MKRPRIFRSLLRSLRQTAITLAAGATVTACGGAAQSTPALPVSTVAGISSPLSRVSFRRPSGYHGLRALYVSSAAYYGEIRIYGNKTYQQGSTIYTGFADQGPDVLDAQGNLYVINGYVYEYAPDTNVPFFVYDTQAPLDIATDTAGNLYVADGSYVSEYAQASNTLVNWCEASGADGIIVGKSGAVFISLANDGGAGRIGEFPTGLAGCNGVLLGATLGFSGGIAIDRQGNLVVCDEYANAIDIIAPPYATITRSISSPGEPTRVKLDKGNRYAFVVDGSRQVVQVLNYPSGTVVTELHVPEPRGVVDGPNAVY
jgi:hypothetical protein